MGFYKNKSTLKAGFFVGFLLVFKNQCAKLQGVWGAAPPKVFSFLPSLRLREGKGWGWAGFGVLHIPVNRFYFAYSATNILISVCLFSDLVPVFAHLF